MIRKIYVRLRKIMPKSLKGAITQTLYTLQIKPTTQKVKSILNKGIVVFSADFEMAWAFRFSKKRGSLAYEMGLMERKNVSIILKFLDDYNVPITWATVGHLFLEKCEVNSHLAHSNMPRPNYFENRNWRFESGDWYQHDPCTSYTDAPAWYAPDLIKQIIEAKVCHEIGCHTFSHVDFTYKNCPVELATAEINECVILAREQNLELKSMVFPGGTAGNYETLAKNGFLCYRKPMKYNIDLPYMDKYGLIAIPSSLGLDKDPYGWSKAFHLKIIKSFIKKAAKHKLVCHFWFHPSMDSWYLEEVLPEVLNVVNEYKERGLIEVKTMKELATSYKTLMSTKE